jgi:DNA mismatch endonuclease (patch repair protein)
MDRVPKKVRSKIMSRIKGKNSKSEILLRKALFNAGYRYRVNYRISGYRSDIVLASDKVAIFVDGCFWHKCPKCYREPKSNKRYWIPKIEENVARDRRIDAALKDDGWRVFHFWEHEINRNVERCLAKIKKH